MRRQQTYSLITAVQQRFNSVLHAVRTVSITTSFAVGVLLLVVAGTVTAALHKNALPRADTTDKQTIKAQTLERMPADATKKDVHAMSTQTTGTATNENTTQTIVSVNGETVTVPANESYQQSYTTDTGNGTTQVDISVENHSSTGTSDAATRLRTRERTRVDVRSESSSSTIVNNQ